MIVYWQNVLKENGKSTILGVFSTSLHFQKNSIDNRNYCKAEAKISDLQYAANCQKSLLLFFATFND